MPRLTLGVCLLALAAAAVHGCAPRGFLMPGPRRVPSGCFARCLARLRSVHALTRRHVPLACRRRQPRAERGRVRQGGGSKLSTALAQAQPHTQRPAALQGRGRLARAAAVHGHLRVRPLAGRVRASCLRLSLGCPPGHLILSWTARAPPTTASPIRPAPP